VPTWVDVVAIVGWSVIGAVVGWRVLSAPYSGHVAGIAAVVATTGYRGSSVDGMGAMLGASVLAVVVIAIAWVIWAIAGLTTRRTGRAPSTPAAGLIRVWVAFPYVVMFLRWLG
jgi:hypothetical protein